MSDQKSYSQLRAMLAITRASLRSIFRSPAAVVFSIAFPLIFIIVFGFIGDNGIVVDVGIPPECDTLNPIYAMMKSRPEVKLIHEPLEEMNDDLIHGRIAAMVNINRSADSSAPLIVNLQTSSAAKEGEAIMLMFMNHAIDKANLAANPNIPKVAELRPQEIEGRAYKSIDFILPGMLGFSLLSTGVFGTAFVFFNLRSTLVLKRFFATPIRRHYIVVGEAQLSRVTFATITSSFIIILGYFAFGFTLVHGLETFLLMLILSFIGLFVFMGFGFVVSSVATNDSVIPVFANLITLPQFLLAGTFFPTDAFPWWLQPVTKILPLTYLNDAMRKIAFEGVALIDVWKDLLVLGIWGVVIYFIAAKVFKWE